jgi:hypothetical protein
MPPEWNVNPVWHAASPCIGTTKAPAVTSQSVLRVPGNLLRILQRSVLALPDPAPLAGEYQQVGMLDAAPFGARVPA